VNEAGEKVMFGTEGATTLTVPEKPFRPAAETVSVPDAPAAICKSGGEVWSEKSGAAPMTSVSPADRSPAIPAADPVKATA